MCESRCHEPGGPWITYDPQCPEHGDDPNNCGYECHMIGGPWIAENPDCPIHGANAPKDY
jgi:hypothetical protein